MLRCAITAHLSPWWGYPPPALHCRSSGWCQRGGSSRSRPSHLPTASIGRRTPSGCCRALGSHGPLEDIDGRGERTDRGMKWWGEVCRKKRTQRGNSGVEVKRVWCWDLSAGVSTFCLQCWSCIISCLSEFLQCSAVGDQPCQMSHYIVNICVSAGCPWYI